MDPKAGLIIQLVGVSLIALLAIFLKRTIDVYALKRWSKAWLLLSVSLVFLLLTLNYEAYAPQFLNLSFLAEYGFGFLLVAGCRNFSGTNDTTLRQKLLFLPFVFLALGLPYFSNDLELTRAANALVMSAFYGIAFVVLWPAKLRTFGWRVMLIALGMLAVNSVKYLFVTMGQPYAALPTGYLVYRSLIDLMFQTLLGFGMVMVVLERVLADVRTANEELQTGHKKLEEIAHIDPLTTALNRHAFFGYLNRRGDETSPVSGCVGFFDIDDMKSINDLYGHDVGDSVIRAVVRAIREIIRAEDLIFRWGGDEFCVIMIGFDAKPADERMKKMESLLSSTLIKGVDHPIAIGVSHGFENFADLDDLEATIKQADAGMYRSKKIRKEGVDVSPVSTAHPAANSEIHAGIQ